MTRTLADIHSDMARLKAEKKALAPKKAAPKIQRGFRPSGRGQRQPRIKDAAHLNFIRRLPCAACGAPPRSDAAHLRAGNIAIGKRHTGKAEKPDDAWTAPLCRPCHTSQHGMNELAFWSALGIDPFDLCRSLYAHTGDEQAALSVIRGMGR